jgi:hypothetical protein
MRLLPHRTRSPDRLLRDALRRINTQLASASGSPTDVQLLGQVSVSEDWQSIREHWTRRAGLTGAWPNRVGPNEVILNLWPIVPGRLQLTTGVGAKPQKRQPQKLLGTPALACYDPAVGRKSSEDALARTVASWVDDVLSHGEFSSGLRLAPPILEEWASKGRLMSRRVLAFDLEWPLAAAEGLTWPVPA